MRHKFLVLTVKKLLKSMYIYGSYRKIKTGVSLFLDHPVHEFILHNTVKQSLNQRCGQLLGGEG